MTANSYAFEGKTVLITGGGSGIGRAIARAFLDNGARVAIVGRRVEKLAETFAGHPDDRVLAIGADVADPAAAAEIVGQVVDRFGGLDVFVNNAASYFPGPLTDLPLTDWQTMRQINIDGFVQLSRQVLPELEKTRGNIVIVGSVSGLRGDWGQAAYNATKAAIMNLGQSLALDYGPKGVRINSVAPSLTITDATAGVAEDAAALAASVNRIALARPGKPTDIAPAVLFLASPDAAYITGAILTVDGGTSASTGQAHTTA